MIYPQIRKCWLWSDYDGTFNCQSGLWRGQPKWLQGKGCCGGCQILYTNGLCRSEFKGRTEGETLGYIHAIILFRVADESSLASGSGPLTSKERDLPGKARLRVANPARVCKLWYQRLTCSTFGSWHRPGLQKSKSSCPCPSWWGLGKSLGPPAPPRFVFCKREVQSFAFLPWSERIKWDDGLKVPGSGGNVGSRQETLPMVGISCSLFFLLFMELSCPVLIASGQQQRDREKEASFWLWNFKSCPWGRQKGLIMGKRPGRKQGDKVEHPCF